MHVGQKENILSWEGSNADKVINDDVSEAYLNHKML